MSARYRRRPAAARLSPVDELAAAIAALDVAAAATTAAHEATWNAPTLRAEDRAWAEWHRCHEAQNAAARRLHEANRALGRTPRDVSPVTA